MLVSVYEHSGLDTIVSIQVTRCVPTVGSQYYSLYKQKGDEEPVLIKDETEFTENDTCHPGFPVELHSGEKILAKVSNSYLRIVVTGMHVPE